MKTTHSLSRSFVRQSGPDDCGLACLSMILRYAGMGNLSGDLHSAATTGMQSLYTLKQFAGMFGVSCDAVTMDISNLRTITTPVILHMSDAFGNHHFQVCYGLKRHRREMMYLMADPAQHFYYATEQELIWQWDSRAALIFNDIQQSPDRTAKSDWGLLLKISQIPIAIYWAIPMLTFITSSFGVLLTWALQRGQSNQLIFSTQVITSLIVLLLGLSTLKNGFAYIKECLLGRMANTVHRKLIGQLAEFLGAGSQDAQTALKVRNSLADIQKIEAAVRSFSMTICTDGALLVSFTAAIFFVEPILGAVNLLMATLSAGFIYWVQPKTLLLQADYRHRLSAIQNNLTWRATASQAEASVSGKKTVQNHPIKFLHLLESTVSRITHATGTNLVVLDILATTGLLASLAIGVEKMSRFQLPYGQFMLIIFLSYMTGAIFPRIYQACQVITEGADAARQFDQLRSGPSKN